MQNLTRKIREKQVPIISAFFQKSKLNGDTKKREN